MEFLMKSFEYRCYPAGHIYRVNVKSLTELQHIFRYQCAEDGKRTGSAIFKTEKDEKWLEFEEFVFKYFSHELRLPELEYDMDLIGFEDEKGNYEDYEYKKFNHSMCLQEEIKEVG